MASFRATALISTVPSAISGTSSRNNFSTSCGCVCRDNDLWPSQLLADRDDIDLDPGAVSVGLPGHLLVAGMIASILPRSTSTVRESLPC